jgi:hypothetical protein
MVLDEQVVRLLAESMDDETLAAWLALLTEEREKRIAT